MGSDPSIGASLTILAEAAGVPLGGLDGDELDFVAEEARTGLFLVPRRPDLPHPSQLTAGTVRESFA